MITILPIDAKVRHQEFSTTIEGTEYGFEFVWHDREGIERDTDPGGAFYMNIFEADKTPILRGVKVVLGVFLGRRSTHPLFSKGAFLAHDTNGNNEECGVDDFGDRILLGYFTVDAIVAEFLGSGSNTPDAPT